VYATLYETAEGYASVGLLVNLQGDLEQGAADLVDPVWGERSVARNACCHVIWTEGGEVLPFVTPLMAEDYRSGWLDPAGGDLELAANRPEPSRGYISGYPLAYKRVRHWREGVAPDWRSIALIFFFARSTIKTKTDTAHRAYAAFGPILRELLEADAPLTEPEIRQLPRFRSLGLMRERAEAFAQIPEYAAWLATELAQSRDYSRRLRNRVAQAPLVAGIGLAKLSFALSLLGRDGACLDAEILKAWFGSVEQAAAVQQRVSDKTACRRRCFSSLVVRRYAALEERLKRSAYWDRDWPMPYAKAQWMLWESLVRPDGAEDHSALWRVLGL
jgi:hypothetical protein